MKYMKKVLCAIMVFAMILASIPSAFAFDDVAADDWYADAVAYVESNQLMSGTEADTFDSGASMTRAMLATVLWRMEGSPAASGELTFEDVGSDLWYTQAIRWAVSAEVISGYNTTAFGTEDFVTREQMATLLYRYAQYSGSAAATGQLSFSDNGEISDWAQDAVIWAQQTGMMSGKPGNVFDPKGNITRAEVATVLMNYGQDIDEQPPASGDRVLVAYYSKTGNTDGVASYVHSLVGGDLVQVTTVTPYPDSHEETVAQAREEQDTGYRPPLETQIANMDDYDVIYLGYPIWWSTMPPAMFTFLESYDFEGKTIIPFCTHGGSRLGSSVNDIRTLCPDSTILDGLAISRDNLEETETAVQNWLQGLGIIN